MEDEVEYYDFFPKLSFHTVRALTKDFFLLKKAFFKDVLKAGDHIHDAHKAAQDFPENILKPVATCFIMLSLKFYFINQFSEVDLRILI